MQLLVIVVNSSECPDARVAENKHSVILLDAVWLECKRMASVWGGLQQLWVFSPWSQTLDRSSHGSDLWHALLRCTVTRAEQHGTSCTSSTYGNDHVSFGTDILNLRNWARSKSIQWKRKNQNYGFDNPYSTFVAYPWVLGFFPETVCFH